MTTEQAGAAPPTVARRVPDDEISLWEVLAVLVRRRVTIVTTTVVVAALAVTFTLRGDDEYTTSAIFRPQGSEASASQLMALASQFGVNVPGGSAEELSPDFYAELLQSREILWRIASGEYDVEGIGRTTLADLLEIEEDTEDLRREVVLEWLTESALTVATSLQTGTVTATLVTEWPDLSQEIVARMLDEIALFNLDTRQSQAAAERTFIEARVDSARVELTEAENELQAFLEANRQWQDAPLLVFQEARLQREVVLKNSVLTTLVQSYEQARIQEVRDTPLITVLQAPFMPSGPDDRPLLLAIALGIVLGGMMGLVLAFVVEAIRSPAEGDPARADFQESWAGLMRSIPILGRHWA